MLTALGGGGGAYLPVTSVCTVLTVCGCPQCSLVVLPSAAQHDSSQRCGRGMRRGGLGWEGGTAREGSLLGSPST